MYGGIFGYHEPGTYCLEAKIPEASCWKIPAWPRNHCLKNGLSHKSSTFIHHPSQVPSELHPLLRAWLVSSHVTLFLVIYSTRKCTLQKKKSGIAWMPFFGLLVCLVAVGCLLAVGSWLVGLALLFLQLGTSQGFQHLWQRHVQLCHGEGSKVKESAKLIRLWEMDGDTYGNLHSCTEFCCLVSGMHLSIFFWGGDERNTCSHLFETNICSGLLT